MVFQSYVDSYLAKLSVAQYRDLGVSTESKQPNLNFGSRLINNRSFWKIAGSFLVRLIALSIQSVCFTAALVS